jgi:ADP-heptose:LPS heptosyltransferase
LGYNFKGRGRFLTQRVPLSGYSGKHIVEYYAELLKYLKLDLKYRQLELYLKKEDIKEIEELLAKEGLSQTDFLVGIIPGAGASWGKDAQLKHWPAENFARLADKIIENYQAKIIIMGDFSEQEIAKQVMAKMHHKAWDLTGKTTLSQLAALLSKARLVITNDGGPLHMAVALGVKSVSIFGPVDNVVYGPYPASDKYTVIKKELTCRPCYQKFRIPACDRDRECINSISTEDVLAAVSSLIMQ